MSHHTKRPTKVMKKITSGRQKKEKSLIAIDAGRNISSLPTKGEFDHTHRPGSIQWKTPKINNIVEPKNSKTVALGPVYRLPLDTDDTGSQIRMEWGYSNLKIRPERLTIEAVGPNRATWGVTVIDGTKTTATWDLRATPSYSPLIEGFYTIQIFDQRGPDTAPKPGWVLPDKKLKLALYKTEEHHIGESIKPSECATCYRFVMQDSEKIQNFTSKSRNNNYVNIAIILIISFFWALL